MSKRELEIASALERAALYFVAHPGSPSAVRSPKLFRRCGVWVALLGRNLREGIAGMGPTVEAALRAFDVHYLNALRRPEEALLDGGVLTRSRMRSTTDPSNDHGVPNFHTTPGHRGGV